MEYLLFARALLGYFLIRTVVLIISPGRPNALHLAGILEGTRDILWDRIES